MQICQNCNNKHEGIYGSGRFCDEKCARGFSTKQKRVEINAKVSGTLSGRPPAHDKGFKMGPDERRYVFTDIQRKNATEKRRQTCKDIIENAPFETLSKYQKSKRIKFEQNNSCLFCSRSRWLGKQLIIEIDHIDGNKQNNQRENLRGLCPNCHSTTPTYKGKNNKKKSRSFE